VKAENLPETGFKVAFFVGCLLDKLFPETANHVDVLAITGQAYYTEPQGVAASPSFISDRETFNR
jgi:hypothetical protein